MNDRAEHDFDDAQLRVLLKTLGHPVRGKMKRETMLAKIEELQSVSGKKIPTDPVSAVNTVLGLEKTPAVASKIGGVSQEQVLDAVRANVERGMEVKFDEWGWVFSRKGRTDSGTLSQPLANIVKCANAVCIEMPKATAFGDPARYA
jgi:hypothetical protein